MKILEALHLLLLTVPVRAFSPSLTITGNYRTQLHSTQIPIEITPNTQDVENDEASLGAIAMNVDELAEIIGGKGRSRLVWDYYRIGIDPLKYFRNEASSGNVLDAFMQGIETNDEDIQNLLPSSRKTQPLGKDALERLSSLYEEYGGKLEGGVAKLSHVSRANDGTTKMLIELKDGLEVETVIIPWFDKGWSTICISSQVGCKQGCTFCNTGRMGKLRNLSANEILSQFFYALKICRLASIPELTNVGKFS